MAEPPRLPHKPSAAERGLAPPSGRGSRPGKARTPAAGSATAQVSGGLGLCGGPQSCPRALLTARPRFCCSSRRGSRPAPDPSSLLAAFVAPWGAHRSGPAAGDQASGPPVCLSCTAWRASLTSGSSSGHPVRPASPAPQGWARGARGAIRHRDCLPTRVAALSERPQPCSPAHGDAPCNPAAPGVSCPLT